MDVTMKRIRLALYVVLLATLVLSVCHGVMGLAVL
jgi:predicted small secreted protein